MSRWTILGMLFQLNDRLAKCAGDGGIGIAHNPRGGRLLASVTSSYPSLPTLLPGCYCLRPPRQRPNWLPHGHQFNLAFISYLSFIFEDLRWFLVCPWNHQCVSFHEISNLDFQVGVWTLSPQASYLLYLRRSPSGPRGWKRFTLLLSESTPSFGFEGDLVNLGLARVSMCLLATAPASSRIVGAKGLHVSSEIFLLNCSGCPMSSATYGWR